MDVQPFDRTAALACPTHRQNLNSNQHKFLTPAVRCATLQPKVAKRQEQPKPVPNRTSGVAKPASLN
jgi:hypothetical protein